MAELLNHALVSLAELREYLTVQGNNSDPQLVVAANQATLAIESKTGRQLVSRGDTAITEYHSIDLSVSYTELYVSEWPIISVTTLHEDDSWPRAYGAGALLVEGTDFETVKRDGIIRRLGSGGPQLWKPGSRIVKLVYKAGYRNTDSLPAAGIDIPQDLKLAALFVASSIFKESDRQRWGVSAVTDAVGTVTRFLGYFTPQINEMLSPYVRREHHRTWEKAA